MAEEKLENIDLVREEEKNNKEDEELNLLAEQFGNKIIITEEYFIVEQVLNHRGTTRHKIQFFIKWQGYPDNKNSWEPWNPDI